VDLALSQSVLEYITPEDIRDIHISSHRWLTPNSLWIHVIGTSDNRARQDGRLHPYDFLKYSDKRWLRLSGNRYAYNNRLRLPQYRSLFREAGWHVACERAPVSERAVSTLNRVRIHADFHGFSPEELIAGPLQLALVRANRMPMETLHFGAERDAAIDAETRQAAGSGPSGARAEGGAPAGDRGTGIRGSVERHRPEASHTAQALPAVGITTGVTRIFLLAGSK
jgi:hypothetical protein